MQVELKVVGGKQNNQVVPLPQGKFLIGREQDCHLRPNSEMVSRHHCVFTTDEFGIRVRDLGSTNGTFVNGDRIEKQVVLKEGDRVVIGTLNFEVVVRETAVVAATAGVAAAEAPIEAPPAPEAIPAETPTAGEAGAETMFDMPAVGDDTQAIGSGDTTMIPVQPPQQAPAPPGYPPQQAPMPYAPPPIQYPPGYPQQYQPQPMYPPQYPGMAYPPQPQMPPGYPPQMAAQQMPVAPIPAPAEPEAVTEDDAVPDVTLPKPSETGIKEETDSKGSGGSSKSADNPSGSAGDIIKQYIQRRPS